MRSIRGAAFLAGTVVWSTIFLAPSSAQITLDQHRFALSAILEQLSTRDGDPVYDFYVDVRPFLSDPADVESLIGPDGTIATADVLLDRHVIQGENLSLSAAQAAFTGVWTFTERRDTELLVYEFTLPEITTDLFPETPTIVSPMQGDTVGTEFLVDWEYASGVEPNGYLISVQGLGGGARAFDPIDNTSQNVTASLNPGFSEADLTIRVGNPESQRFDIIPVTPGGDAMFSFRALSITAMSQPTTVTLRIPEPSTILLLGIAAPLLITRRRRLIN